MTAKQPDLTDINALAMEACDMWQEHLSNLANDPAARAELTRFLEPQRRLFADWASMMRQGGSHDSTRASADASAKSEAPSEPSGPAPESAAEPNIPEPAAEPAFEPAATAASPAATPSGGAAYGDDPLRVAQLALRLAELEKRVAQLESRSPVPPR